VCVCVRVRACACVCVCVCVCVNNFLSVFVLFLFFCCEVDLRFEGMQCGVSTAAFYFFVCLFFSCVFVCSHLLPRAGACRIAGGGSVEPSIDEMLSPLRLSRASAGEFDIEVDEILRLSRASGDAADTEASPRSADEGSAHDGQASAPAVAAAAPLDEILEIILGTSGAPEPSAAEGAAVDGVSGVASSVAVVVTDSPRAASEQALAGDVGADAAVVTPPAPLARPESPLRVPVFPPGIRDPMAAPTLPSMPTSPSFRPGVFDPMAVRCSLDI
jgi:hypothetical protein